MVISTKNEADILSRIIDPQKPGLSTEAAQSLLALSFGMEDVQRINELSEKATGGQLTSDEQEELDSYERVGHLLAILQSKARASLNGITSDTSEL